MLKKWAQARNMREFCRRYGLSYMTLRDWMAGTRPTEGPFEAFAQAVREDQRESDEMLDQLRNDIFYRGAK